MHPYAGLFVLRHDDAVNHVDDAVGCGDVGLHDLRAVNIFFIFIFCSVIELRVGELTPLAAPSGSARLRDLCGVRHPAQCRH